MKQFHHGMSGMGCPTCGCMGHGSKKGGFPMKMFKMMPWKIMMHHDELGLSEEQMESLRNRHADALKQMIQIKSQIKINKIDIMNAVMREEIDMQAAEAKIREVGKLKGDLLVTMIQAVNDMRHILTHEQRLKVKWMVMSWFKKGGMPGMGMEEGDEADEGEEGEAEE